MYQKKRATQFVTIVLLQCCCGLCVKKVQDEVKNGKNKHEKHQDHLLYEINF
jgi:hypothetical protein